MLPPENANLLLQWLGLWSKSGIRWAPRLDDHAKHVMTSVESIPAASVASNERLSVAAPVLGSPIVSQEPAAVQVPPALVSAPPVAMPSPGMAPASHTPWEMPKLTLEQRVESLASLRSEVQACRKCADLACSRKQTVFGVGNPNARIAFFGEAPGADEDAQGEPFVGKAGQLLNKIMTASQLRREDVYILNALRCRPPGNRTPTDAEIEACRPFFEKQLEIVQPDYIVCLGNVAVRAVLKTTESVGRLRGKFHYYRQAKVLVTYHPAYLLRNESAKRLTWEDMQMLMRELGIPLPKRS